MTDQKPHRISIPKYSLSEELLNAISHGLGALFGIVGTVLCIVKAANTGDPWRIVSGMHFWRNCTAVISYELPVPRAESQYGKTCFSSY